LVPFQLFLLTFYISASLQSNTQKLNLHNGAANAEFAVILLLTSTWGSMSFLKHQCVPFAIFLLLVVVVVIPLAQAY
jgi:hypothetical protein